MGPPSVAAPPAHRAAARFVLSGVALVAAIALFATGCGGAATSTESTSASNGVSNANKDLVESSAKPVMGGKLVYGLTAETNGWNPATNQWATPGQQVARALFDTLAAFDDQSQVRPYLAAGFEHNPDFTQWKIKLRPGVTLSNGKPVTADTVVRDQEYLKKSTVVGGAFTFVKGYSAEGSDTVVVDLTDPWANYPMSLATQLGVVSDPDWLTTNDSLHPVGTGPFMLDSWQIGNKLVVKKNPNYWQTDKDGARLPYLDSIEFRVMPDSTSRGNALRAKDIDVMESLDGNQIRSFQDEDTFQIFSNSKGESSEMFIQLNTTSAPLDDLNARRALAYATDKETITDQLTGGLDETADGPFGKSSPWYTDTDYPQYDPTTAKSLVDEVKSAHGGKFAMTLSAAPDQFTQQLAQMLQAQWSAVGIDVTIQTVEQAALIISVVTGKYQATTWLQFGNPNPSLDSVYWRPDLAVAPPTFSLNFTRLKDEEIGSALKAARATADPAVFKAQYAIVQKRLAADVPYVWLYHQQVALIASKRVTNLTKYTLPDGATGLDLSNGTHPLGQVWLQP
jgi:ABC-type transport system substrate-binding protein